MPYTVIFYVRSSMLGQRRIKIVNHEYPFQPQLGGYVEFWAVNSNFVQKARIIDINYPASNYFKSEVAMWCTLEMDHRDFDGYYNFLENLKKEHGLTHQWESWSIYSV